MGLIDFLRAKKYTDLQGSKDAHRYELMLQKARQAKGGVIGTSGKPVVSIRFDDGHNVFKDVIYPLVRDRGLPCSLAHISRPWKQPWGNAVTYNDIRTWNQNGVEIWSHGTDHKDPTPDGYAGLIREIVTSKEEIEAEGLKCQGWAQPGATPLTEAMPYGADFTDISHYYDTDAGRLMLRHYALIQGYVGGALRILPQSLYVGLNHITIDRLALATITGWVDYAVRTGRGVQFMVHPHYIGGASFLSLADFTAFLDYVVGKWNDGEIEVLTPSGMYFANPGADRRVNLIHDGSFELGFTGPFTGWNINAAHTRMTDGGRSGDNYLRVPSTSAVFTTQRPQNLDVLGFSGETFVFEGWCRSNGASNTVARVIIQDYNDTTRLNLNKTLASVTSSWTRVRFAFSLHPLTRALTVGISRNSGDGIDWDDVSIKKA